jgi:hypothetical protein
MFPVSAQGLLAKTGIEARWDYGGVLGNCYP